MGIFTKIIEYFNTKDLETITNLYFKIPSQADKAFFILEKNNESNFEVYRLCEKINSVDKLSNFRGQKTEDIFLCFSDPCCFENAGWYLRLFLAAIVHLWYVINFI